MNILITGGLGFIGSHLVSKLKVLGYNTITVDIKEGADYVLDISKDDLSVISEPIDIIYHLAAQPFGKGSEIDPNKDCEFNVKGTLQICRFAKHKNVTKLIYTSTVAVYGDTAYAAESDQIDTLSNYAVSKYSGELYVKKYSQESNYTYSILRLWNTFGPGQDLSNENKGVVSVFATQILKGNTTINVTGSLNRFRDIIYIDDVIDALIHVMSLANSDVYNVSTGVKTTIEELIYMIIDTIGYDKSQFQLNNIGSHTGDQFGCIGNNNKLTNTGWHVNVPLLDGITQFIEYIKTYETR